MKKLLRLVIVSILLVGLVGSTAHAASWAAPLFSPGDSTQTGNEVKASGNGVAAIVNITSFTGQWIYRIRKATDGVFVSQQLRFPSSTGNHSLAYDKDGYGITLGRTGYSYRLNVAYYSQAIGNGSSYGNFTP